jgi:hypothetical protein
MLFSPLQLASYIHEPGEFALSKDVDVSLWLESRAFSNQPALQEVQDFVVVNHSLLKEFKEFQSSRIDPEFSYLPAVDLLQLWIAAQKPLPRLVVMFGKRYARMHRLSIDSLVQWIYTMRVQFDHKGRCVFEPREPSSTTLTSLPSTGLPSTALPSTNPPSISHTSHTAIIDLTGNELMYCTSGLRLAHCAIF